MKGRIKPRNAAFILAAAPFALLFIGGVQDFVDGGSAVYGLVSLIGLVLAPVLVLWFQVSWTKEFLTVRGLGYKDSIEWKSIVRHELVVSYPREKKVILKIYVERCGKGPYIYNISSYSAHSQEALVSVILKNCNGK